MIITNSYKEIMGTRRDAFHKAFRYFLENTKGVTQDKVSKKTGIKQGMISGMKTGKRYGTEDGRRLVAEYFGKTYDDFIAVGETLLEAEGRVGVSLQETSTSHATPSNIHQIDDVHVGVIKLFQDKKTALEINQILVQIEQAGPGKLVKAKKLLTEIFEDDLEDIKKRPAANDKG